MVDAIKILHINNTAGVGSLIIKELSSRPYYRFDMSVYGKNDPFHFTPAKYVSSGKLIYYFRTLLKAFGADLIHIHARDRFLKYLKPLGVPLILHYHGSDIRGRWREKEPVYRNATRVMVATHDLLQGAPEYVAYIPNPIDRDHFKHLPKIEGNKAFTFSHDADDLAHRIADKYGVPLDVLPRSVAYQDLPLAMAAYKYYVDVKRVNGETLPRPGYDFLSKTALECLSRGITVLRDSDVITDFPEEHDSKKVAESWDRLYRETISTHQ
jgi:hypothetical protein